MALRVMTVVGARPQFVKAAMLSRAIAADGTVEETLVHTGQHFDRNMSQVFFDELGIPRPDANLGISGGTHAQMTGRMMEALEAEMQRVGPDAVIVFGDTNSTLAAALVAAKLNIPLVHIEAGPRMGFLSNPEEINRVCTDHVATLCIAPTEKCLVNLQAEGLGARSVFLGDLMYDAFAHFSRIAAGRPPRLRALADGVEVLPGSEFCYLTCHRQENSSERALGEVLAAAAAMDAQVVYPVHPRLARMALRLSRDLGAGNVLLVEPVGYLDSLALMAGCSKVVTDSGGLQREAFFARKKCVTLLPFPSAEELLVGNRNMLVDPVTSAGILAALEVGQEVDPSYLPFGDGRAAGKMVAAIKEMGA